MEERISEVLARHSIRLIQFEVSRIFGNLLLTAATPNTQLRFVRDRGCNSCEICKKNDGLLWENDLLSASPPFSHISDFCDFVDSVLTAKNL